MNALAHRLGRVIITFVWKESDAGWQRHVVAPRFVNSVAQGSKDHQPICLLLSGGHFRALVPKTSNTTIPQAWFKQTPEVARGELRGGVVLNLSLPSSPLSPDPRTPKRKRTDACAPTSTVRLSLPPSPDESVSGLDLPEVSPLAASVPCVPQTGLHA